MTLNTDISQTDWTIKSFTATLRRHPLTARCEVNGRQNDIPTESPVSCHKLTLYIIMFNDQLGSG